MDAFPIYKSQVNVERQLELLNASSVPVVVKEQITSFSRIRLAKGCSRARVVKCLYCLRFLAKWFNKDFSTATKDDVIGLVNQIDLQNYAEHTKYDFKVILKIFYKWLLGNDEDFPEVIKWLKPKLKNEKHKLPEELLTVEEVEKLAGACTNARDKALVLILYESGCRIGELFHLKLKNIQFDNYGAVLLVNGKTGYRRVRIIVSCQILSQWLQEHPDKDNSNAPLWPARFSRYNSEPCRYSSILAMLDRARQISGVKKRIYPHLFRHSRATALASKLTEAQMKEYFGWVQGSDMAATYVHLSGRDVDSTLLQLYSLKDKPIEKEAKLDVKVCHRCKERNSPSQSFCGRCGNPFDESKLLVIPKEGDGVFTALFKDLEFRELFIRKVGELGVGREVVA